MCLFRRRNLFEKDSKKYIEYIFAFLIERGYECKYYNRGGEEEFVFAKEIAQREYAEGGLHIFADGGTRDGRNVIPCLFSHIF